LTDAAHGSPMRQLIFSPFSLEFQMGALVALTYKEVAALKIPVGLYITSSLGGLMMIYAVGLFMEAGGVYPDNNHLARVLVYGLAALAMLFSIVQLDAAAVARPALKAPRWGVFLGDASYALYLVHIPIINTAYKLFAHVVPHPKFGVALIAFVMIAAIVFAGAILFHTTVERRMILFFHTLSTKLFNKPNVAGAG
jgi:peptidoglycan/LPS O-acetylase OafA/YrhL